LAGVSRWGTRQRAKVFCFFFSKKKTFLHTLDKPRHPDHVARSFWGVSATVMSAFFEEKVLSVHHWTDALFSFTCTRDPTFRFKSGQFTMIGLLVDGRPLLRAYSMVSGHWEEHLEYLSIKVQDGPLTSRLQHIQVGATVLIGRKPVGTLLPETLLAGRNLYMVATGTGLAPFMSLIRDPDTYDKFDRVVLVHGCRTVAELAYQDVINGLPHHELLGDMAAEKLLYYPTVTREAFKHQGRVTDLIFSGQLPREMGLPELDKTQDRIMLCGSPGLLADYNAWFTQNGWIEGNNTASGQYVIEKAFVEK
jgi:ferredoxin--NADP+ reductase